MWNLFKGGTRTRTQNNNTNVVLLFFIFNFEQISYCFGVSIVDFEQVNTDWEN